MSELNKFTRLFKNVKNCKNLNWQEKAILSEIISYQLDGKPFKLKDLTIALELAMDKGSVSRFIRQLSLKDVINKTTVTFPSPSGGKPKRLRTITVVDIERWTQGYVVPVLKTIEPSTKKSEEQISTIEPVIDIQVIPVIENKPSTKQAKVKKDKSNTSDIITLDSEKDIDNSTAIGTILIAKLKRKEPIEFKKVHVRFGSDIYTDEATVIPNGKSFLKSTLKAIDASVFE